MSSRPILIIHQGALGDVVLTFPGILALGKGFRKIHLLCRASIGPVARAAGVAAGVLPLEAAAFSSLYSGFADRVDPRVKALLASFHCIVLFSFSEPLARTLRSVFPRNVHRIPPRPRRSRHRHVAEYILDALGSRGLIGPVDRELPPPAGPWAFMGRTDGAARVVIHPGSGSRRKNWPVRNFVETAIRLEREGWPTVFLLGPAENHLGDRLKALGTPGERILVVEDSEELVGILRAATGFIGNDSGVTHLASFLGLPVVAVFGPSDPRRWRPVGGHATVVRPDVGCMPCFETGKENCDEEKCLDLTTPEVVAEAFLGISAGVDRFGG